MRLTALLALLCFTVTASAELYTWTDADGHKHFGDKPPVGANTDAQPLEEKKAYSPGSDPRAKEIYDAGNRMLQGGNQNGLRSPHIPDPPGGKTEARKKACENARAHALQLDSQPVVAQKDARTPSMDTPAMRALELESLRRWIVAFCY